MTTEGFTTRSEVRAAMDRICTFARDVIAITAYRSPRFTLGQGYGHAGSMALRATAPGISSHRRLELEAKLANDCQDELIALEALFSKIPKWGPKSGVQFDYSDISGQAILKIGMPEVTFQFNGDKGGPEATLTTQIYSFIRINENLEMGPDLKRWSLAPEVKDFWGIVWADTADNALLRFAAASSEVRSNLRQGHMYKVMPVNADVPLHIKAAIDKRVRKTPAPKHDWVFAE